MPWRRMEELKATRNMDAGECTKQADGEGLIHDNGGETVDDESDIDQRRPHQLLS